MVSASLMRILCCLRLATVVNGQGPLLIVEVPAIMALFSEVTVVGVAEGGVVAVGEGAVAAGEVAVAAGEATMFTVGELAGVSVLLSEDAFFIVSEEAEALAEELLEASTVAADIPALSPAGKILAGSVAAKGAQELCAAAVGDLGEFLGHAEFAATPEATERGVEFVKQGGKLLHPEVQADAAKHMMQTIGASKEQTEKTMSWLAMGMKLGTLGDRTKNAFQAAKVAAKPVGEAVEAAKLGVQGAVKTAISEFALMRSAPKGPTQTLAEHNALLPWLAGSAVMGVATVAIGMAKRFQVQPRSCAAEDAQRLIQP